MKFLMSIFPYNGLFTFLKETFTLYIHDIYRKSGQNQANTKSSVLKLKHSLRNTCSGHKELSYLTSIIWNSLPMDLKLPNSLNNFKHKLKDHFLLTKLGTWREISLLIGRVLGTATPIF